MKALKSTGLLPSAAYMFEIFNNDVGVMSEVTFGASSKDGYTDIPLTDNFFWLSQCTGIRYGQDEEESYSFFGEDGENIAYPAMFDTGTPMIFLPYSLLVTFY